MREVETITRKRFIGAGGREFDTEAEAMRSLVVRDIRKIIECGGSYYDFDPDEAARGIVRQRKDVLTWLTVLTKAEEEAVES